MNYAIAIDPGREKCGLILADLDNHIVIEGKVVISSSVLDLIIKWQNNYEIKLIILGNGTSSNFWYLKLIEVCKLSIKLVEESGTTFRARGRYFEISSPNFFLRFIPKQMRIPPKNLDSFAALLLLEDYLHRKFQWLGDISLKTWPE
ncbi:hypothetical protein [Prochlorococcus marinus]|uniref:YqgF/RNase H-like domain-containing protein n=1 Tax=Prochlorococcus marinus (strain MIT 9211) TaxID=93059 RepID=A9BDL8_PROM4|nr:hypothetical protein [Prochlorococcus marinus]ABX08204.1 conserved hypothetical protein [Prochlorococcus marinus str. MIT 9211]